MNTTPNVNELKAAEFRKRANSAAQRNMSRVGRDLYRSYMGIGRAAGLEPGECHAALALDSLLYDKQSQDTETPRKIPLDAIGVMLTSKADDADKNARWQKAQREMSHLFVHAYPRVGLAMQMRHKGLNLGDGHEYSSRWMAAATAVVQDFDAERRRILTSDTIKREDKGRAIGEAHDRLCSEALGYFDKLDTLIIENNKPFAVVTGPQAEAFHKLNQELFKGEKPKFRTATYAYTPPPPKPQPEDRTFSESDFDQAQARLRTAFEKEFWATLEKEDFDLARLHVQRTKEGVTELYDRAKADFAAMCDRWEEIAGAPDAHTQNGTYIENKELSYTHENEYGAEPADAAEDPASILKNEYDGDRNMTEDSHLENDDVQFSDFDPPEPVTGSVNFDTSLEAALSYVRDGWAIIPCRDKKPLIGGKVKNAGHTAASRDKGLIREWFTDKFPDAGVAIRLDGHILIDVDVKDGKPGLKSFDELDATFNFPATLMAVTPSGGRHYIFKLPEDLPAGYLGNWTDFLAAEDLGGIDIKTGVGGICHVEPTATKLGIYRWVDPCADIAELPRKVCDYFHNVHEQQQRIPENLLQSATGFESQPFDPDEDQSKYVKDVDKGDRHPRLRSIACALAARGANENQIVDVLKFHDSQFKKVGPTSDFKFMAHVAQGAVSKYRQGAAQ